MLRIATSNAFDSGVDTLQTKQRELFEAQSRLTSGKRVTRASDDPTAAARAERARAAEARADAHQRGLEASRNAMSQAEAALGDAGNLLQQAREQMVAAGNGSWSPQERQQAAQALRALRDQLLAVANRGDGTGAFLFGGQGSSEPPFVDAPGGVAWRATSGKQAAASGEPLPLTMDGRGAWLGARSGNGVFETDVVSANGGAWIDAGRVTDPSALTGDDYDIAFTVSGGSTTYTLSRAGSPVASNVAFAPGQAIEFDGMAVVVSGQPADGDRFAMRPAQPDLSVFDALDRATAVLEDANASAAQVTQAVKFGLRDLDAVMSTMNSQRADAGAWLNRIDNVEGRLSGSKLMAQTERSNAEDLDMVQAVSDFQAKQNSYDAALRTYSMVQRLSLFQYLGS